MIKTRSLSVPIKDKDINVKLGECISKKAKRKFSSNVEFADVCGTTETTIRRILLGQQNLTIKILEQVCDSLEIKISDLFKEIGK